MMELLYYFLAVLCAMGAADSETAAMAGVWMIACVAFVAIVTLA